MLRGVVVGGERAVARFGSLPNKLRVQLRIAVQRAATLVQGHSKSDKLSGQVLNVRTGRLRRSIHTRVTESAQQVTGIVGTNVEYARVHEYGFDGIVSVREQLRTSKLGKSFTVRQHARHTHVPEKSFLRSALADEREAIRAEFQRATEAALR
jgi:phage gpG-like protein